MTDPIEAAKKALQESFPDHDFAWWVSNSIPTTAIRAWMMSLECSDLGRGKIVDMWADHFEELEFLGWAAMARELAKAIREVNS